MAGRALMTYTYRCSNGHEAASPRPLESCPACVKGKPCDGELRRVGPGSRKAAAA